MSTAMIFAAGLGTRLRPLTNKTPKPLIEVAGLPMLGHLAASLKQAGVTRLVLNSHWLADQIEDYAHQVLSQEFEVFVSKEPQILGTGGGLQQAKRWLEGDILLINADVLTDLDFTRFLHQHQAHGAEVSLAVNRAPATSNLLIDTEGLVVGVERSGKPELSAEPVGEVETYNFCGIHVVNQTFWSRLGLEVNFSIIDEYLGQLTDGLEVQGIDIGDAYWSDVGTLETLEQARTDWAGLSKNEA